MPLEDKELYSIVGGFKFTAAFFGYALKGCSFLIDVGRNIGSAIRRTINNNLCPM